jgi:hypothetical protein
MREPWEDFKDDPLTPTELQRARHFMAVTQSRLDALWLLWGWLAAAIQDRKMWGAAIAVSALLWGKDFAEAARKLMGVIP